MLGSQKFRRTTRTLLWIAFFGAVMLIYGILSSGSFLNKADLTLETGLRFGITLFLFGMWAGFVVISKTEHWIPKYRKPLHSIAFAILCVVIALAIAHPSSTDIAMVAVVTGIIGYFGEYWIECI